MWILIIHRVGIAIVELKCDAPITAYVYAEGAFALAFPFMESPAGENIHVLRAASRIQSIQALLDLAGVSGLNAFLRAFLVEVAQPFVLPALDCYERSLTSCRLHNKQHYADAPGQDRRSRRESRSVCATAPETPQRGKAQQADLLFGY